MVENGSARTSRRAQCDQPSTPPECIACLEPCGTEAGPTAMSPPSCHQRPCIAMPLTLPAAVLLPPPLLPPMALKCRKPD